MAWKYCDEIIEENDIYDIVADCYDMNDFEDYLNDNYETVNICGYEYEQGTILRTMDETAFKCDYAVECDFIAREIINAMDDTDSWGFGIEYVDEDE